MAKSTTRPPKKPTPIDSSTPFDVPPADTGAAQPAEAAAPEPAVESKPIPPKLPSFYQTMNKVQKADWGPRATIYLYRVEPVIDRTRSGDLKYIMTYAEPINEDRIMADCGSGRYKLILNFRKPGADQGDTVDTTYMEILNMKFPPKIPIGEWTDDPRNRKWAWAKEAAAGPPAPPPQTGVETFVDVLRATGDIRREIREEMRDTAPAPTAAAAPADPFDTAKKIMEMRANDPMVAALMQRLEAMDRSQEASRLREYELQKELRQQATGATAAEKPKTLMEQLTDFKALKDLFTNGSVGEAVRTGRTTALDVARDLGSKFFESDLAMGVGQYLASLATRNVSATGAPAQMNPTAPQNGVQRPVDDFPAFIENVLNPALLRHYIQGFSGADFAGWLYDGYPNRVPQLQAFTHPMMPGLKGQAAIVQAYKNTPNMWPSLSSARPEGETAFVQFVHEFCTWKPEPNEAIDVDPIEATAEDKEEGPERI